MISVELLIAIIRHDKWGSARMNKKKFLFINFEFLESNESWNLQHYRIITDRLIDENHLIIELLLQSIYLHLFLLHCCSSKYNIYVRIKFTDTVIKLEVKKLKNHLCSINSLICGLAPELQCFVHSLATSLDFFAVIFLNSTSTYSIIKS